MKHIVTTTQTKIDYIFKNWTKFFKDNGILAFTLCCCGRDAVKRVRVSLELEPYIYDKLYPFRQPLPLHKL